LPCLQYRAAGFRRNCAAVTAETVRHTQDIGVSQTAPMSHLTHEQQVFVLHQIRNWVFGHYRVFEALNAAWATHGAEPYFWS
jgi:hypothetical protein